MANYVDGDTSVLNQKICNYSKRRREKHHNSCGNCSVKWYFKLHFSLKDSMEEGYGSIWLNISA